jgi:hypothetical protein
MDWRWAKAEVDQSRDHLRLAHDDYPNSVVALVGPPKDGVFPVEFLVADDGTNPDVAQILADVSAKLDYYLVELGEQDPWAYAHYHCRTASNVYGKVHWGIGEDWTGIPKIVVTGDQFARGSWGIGENWTGVFTLEVVDDPFAREFASLDQALAPLIEEAWHIHRRVASAKDGKGVVPSIPILFFGDLVRYLRSPRRVITVGLNPSNQEFPHDDPWLRFPRGAALAADTLDDEARSLYLEELSRYFETNPYRKWFDRSFEPLLHGLDASYYANAASVALHTDIASSVATNPTWSKLKRPKRALHQDGAELWRTLADLLAPDVIVISVAREHLAAVSPLPLEQWEELTRVERERPFIVSAREMTVAGGGKRTLVVFGRCTNVPFGSVSFSQREWIGRQIAARLDELDRKEAVS